MSRLLRIGLWLAALVFLGIKPVLAQGAGRIVTNPPDASKFPGVSLTFEVYDARGNFINDLAQAEVEVRENDQVAPVVSLSRLQPGMHVIMSFNVAPGMGKAAANGATCFDQAKKTILGWSQAQPGSTRDEYSLVTNAGPQATRVADAHQLSDALSAYTPDLAKTQASLTSLTTALDLASDPSRRPDTRRAILYVTAPLPDTALASLPNLAAKAAQLGVRISVWLALPKPGEDRSTKGLSDLAQRTGGQFLGYTAGEGLPNPEIYFQQMRYQYQVSYSSPVRQSGEQRVQVTARHGGLSLASEQKYSLRLLPPNPFFLSPPSQVQRAWTKAGGGEKSILAPETVELQTIVEFPDGLRRPLKASRLFVDGKPAYEATAEPFNPLIWSLAGTSQSGRHVLRVEAEDSLGLSRSSIEIPVQVDVEAGPLFGLAAIAENARPYLPWAGLAGLAALAAIGGAAGWRAFHARRNRPAPPRRSREDHRVRLKADIPVPARIEPFATPDAPARLLHVAETDLSLPGGFIAINQAEIRLGSDPAQVDCVLASPSINGLHARVAHDGNGQFTLYDAGSVAGTWVNYRLVPPEGRLLEHGDQVNLGREVFRFELKNPPAARHAVVVSRRGGS